MSLTDFLMGAFGVLTLVLPGWVVARARSAPQPLLAGFIVSVVVLVDVVLLFDAVRVPLTLGVVGSTWALFIATAVLFRRRCNSQAASPRTNETFGWKTNWTLLLPLIPMLAVVVYRA